VVARRTGISIGAMSAYANTDLRLAVERPSCALSWATLAGSVGSSLSTGRWAGVRWEATGARADTCPGARSDRAGELGRVSDTDGGRLDGDSRFDRALGPMQLLPATWLRWRGDGDGDGRVDPNDIDDASYAAGRFLCASGGSLDEEGAWTQAVLSYNPSGEYAQAVLSATNTYASRASG
jgi:membrane-bound lytic murein transglycosylase B